jgi:hypothetical protein
MRKPSVSQVIRRAVLLHVSLSAPCLIACSGETKPSTFEAGAGDARSDALPTSPCQVLSSASGPVNGGACISWDGILTGTPAECGAVDAAAVPLSTCQRLCPANPMPDAGNMSPVAYCSISTCSGCCPASTACFDVECTYGICGTGRRPAGLGRFPPRRGEGAVARRLAEMAFLEAASVRAFERLAGELRLHRAPRRLVRAARRAVRDEERHARAVGALAERAGAVLRCPQVRPGRARSLEAIARENAVEGCVGETFGAAVNMVQSMTAGDRSVRSTMGHVARDELQHAELAWAIARWIEPRLEPAARRRVARARGKAMQRLNVTGPAGVDEETVRRLGLPTAGQASAIARDLAAALGLPPCG